MPGRPRVRVEEGARRVRAFLGGEAVADTIRPLYVWEKPYYPTYYLPVADVRTDLLEATGESRGFPGLGEARLYTVRAGGREAVGAAGWFRDTPVERLEGTVRLEWEAMDAWFEEDEEVYVHPRDPYKRVDILQSSRHVEVVVKGVKVAESRQPRLLFETGLPTRYYLPKTDVRMDLLTPTDHVSCCPYKGRASYYSLTVDGEVLDNLVWWYPHPTAESLKIAGYVCFYNEKVDIYVDGELQERPETPFS